MVASRQVPAGLPQRQRDVLVACRVDGLVQHPARAVGDQDAGPGGLLEQGVGVGQARRRAAAPGRDERGQRDECDDQLAEGYRRMCAPPLLRSQVGVGSAVVTSMSIRNRVSSGELRSLDLSAFCAPYAATVSCRTARSSGPGRRRRTSLLAPSGVGERLQVVADELSALEWGALAIRHDVAQADLACKVAGDRVRVEPGERGDFDVGPPSRSAAAGRPAATSIAPNSPVPECPGIRRNAGPH